MHVLFMVNVGPFMESSAFLVPDFIGGLSNKSQFLKEQMDGCKAPHTAAMDTFY